MSRSNTLTVEISGDALNILHELAAQYDSDVLEEIKKSISDRKYFVDKVSDGYQIILERVDLSTNQTIRTFVDIS